MARPKKNKTENTAPFDENKKIKPLGDYLKNSKEIITTSMGTTPIVMLDIDSLGFEVAIQNTGFPLNCISMSVADAHAGKTTLSHVIANWFLQNDGDVILAEGDGILDEAYVSRFYTQEFDALENKTALLYFQKTLTKKLEQPNLPQKFKNRLQAQLLYATKLLKKEPENEIEKEALYLAQAAYKMRKITRFDGTTAEDLEKLIAQIYKIKTEHDPYLTRPTLIIVDPITNYIPNEMMENEDSASGKKMGIAAYLNSFFRRWSKKLANAQIHLHLTAKKTTFIKMNQYQIVNDIDQLTTTGGGPQKLAAGLIFFLEYKYEVKNTDEASRLIDGKLPQYKVGELDVPKRKIQGGYAMPKQYRNKYWLFTDRNFTKMDFDLPFIEQVFKLNLFDIKYDNGFAYVPTQFIEEKEFEIKFDEKGKHPECAKMRMSDATRILLNSQKWRNHIHTILGIQYQNIDMEKEEFEESSTESESIPKSDNAPEIPEI